MLIGDWGQAFRSVRLLIKSFGPLLWPFVTGNLILAVLAGFAAYSIGRRFLEARAQRLGDDKDPPPPVPESGAPASS